MIRIQNLSKVFDGPVPVTALNQIDLHVQQGDIFGIIGMSGAGKSTLLRCIALLERPSSGSITVDGVELSSVTGRELIRLRRQIGVIFQGYHLLMQRTVAQNVAFPLELLKTPKREIEARVKELLEMVGLSDKTGAYPAQLSGGQKQRVAIARALANSPKILLCDEPTSALDSLTTKSILDLLQNINRQLGVTIIIITHEIGVVKAICHKVGVIDSSAMVEQGPVKEVFASPQSPITRLLLGQMEEKEGGASQC
ncbi:MAG: ATP-binding cassette domain-containing protein [Oscillospiraceae bacterium]|nr:ATP-binding cassette domain-containing protein [Oscillospiraceae bacterium]